MTNLIKCNDCGDSLNLGQRILNSKRVQGSKLCGPCHQKELKAWKNGEFVAHDGKEYEGKQPRRTESERRERKRERRKHWKENEHVVKSNALGRNVPINEYDKELRKHYKENEHMVYSNALGGRDVPFNEYDNERRKNYKENEHMVYSNALGGRDVPFNEYKKELQKELRKHYKENEHVVKSNTLGGHVSFEKYEHERRKYHKENALREMQAHVSMNRSRCVNSECNRRLSPTWSSFSNMESEVIHLWKLAGITKTEEQVRDELEHMLGTDVSAVMKNSEGVYLCLACKEKKFYKVRQAACAEFLRRRRVERRDEDE